MTSGVSSETPYAGGMPRKRTTTEQGLGWSYQKARASLPPPAGEPCPYCARPMWPEQLLDCDHSQARALGGAMSGLRWAHRSCNRREGARLGNQLRGHWTQPKWIDRWS